MTVTDLSARRRHPAGRARALPETVHLPLIDRAAALTLICSRWEELAGDFATGPDALPNRDSAEELLQVLCSALVAPAAVPTLVMNLPKVRAQALRLEQVRDGIIAPEDLGWNTREQATRAVEIDLACELWPLLTGLPIRDVCQPCSHVIGDVNAWPTKTYCPVHGQRAL